ncbi:MAG: hypothetical protein ACR2ME_04450, partial [Acidimicrobiia bacterium]
MTVSPSEAPADAPAEEAPAEETPVEATSPLADLANQIAQSMAGTAEVNFETAKVRVEPDRWVEALTKARDEHGLTFFSWLSAIDWRNEVA